MGAHPFVPPTPGSTLKNVITIRTIEDVEYLCSKLPEIESCLCIGGGILGIETAGAIAKNGVKVTLLERSDYLMKRQLNKKAADILKEFLHNTGIEVKENARVKEIMGKDYCEGVKLETGEELKSRLVIITAGVRPNTYLARKAGLEVDKGVVVNNYMQTSDANIYAAGDVSEHHGVLYGLWTAAQTQSETAALNILGSDKPFEGVPRSNVVKILGIDVFSIGEKSALDGSYYQYEKQSQDKYANFILRDGKIVGSVIIGDKVLSLKVKQAIEKGLSFPYELYDNVENIINRLIGD